MSSSSSIASASSASSSSASSASAPKDPERLYTEAKFFDAFAAAVRDVAHESTEGNVEKALQAYFELKTASVESKDTELKQGDSVWVLYNTSCTRSLFTYLCTVQATRVYAMDDRVFKKLIDQIIDELATLLATLRMFYPPRSPPARRAAVDDVAVHAILRDVDFYARQIERLARSCVPYATGSAIVSSDANIRRAAMDSLQIRAQAVHEHTHELDELMDKLTKEMGDAE